MSETHAGLCWKDHRWMLVRSWDPELLHEHVRPPRPFPGRTFRNEHEDGPVLPEPGTHFEKVKMLAAEETVNTTKWGSGFVPGIM